MNSKKRCTFCKDYFPADGMIKTPAGTFCCALHALEYTKTKQRKKDKKAHTVEKREYYRQKLNWQHKQTQPVFNRMRVLEELKWFADRNIKPTCISCGNPLGNDVWSCGHLKTVGAQSGLRYDKKNTALQHNRRCNQGLSGDINGSKTTRGYKTGLLERFGEKEGQAIINHCETNTQVVHWTWQQLEEMRKGFNKRIRLLKSIKEAQCQPQNNAINEHSAVLTRKYESRQG